MEISNELIEESQKYTQAKFTSARHDKMVSSHTHLKGCGENDRQKKM
jgi:hypothetical protein